MTLPASDAPRYRSTRAPGGDGVPFTRALRAGLAEDGGLYLPTHVPPLPGDWHEAGSLAELGARVLPNWIGDLPREEVERAARDALALEVPLVPLSDDRWVLELTHGPTLSFKDVGARTMARLLDAALRRDGGRATILVATSGDTGSAVADGFAGMERIDVVLLYPEGRVSPLQERQLTALREGVRALAVEGSFDDCQRLVKEAFRDPALAHLPLTSANSINVGRLLPQSLYYLWAARLLADARGVRPDEAGDLVVVVPSGNLGNLTAGLLAHAAGLPVGRFVAAHNANDFFPRFLGGRAEGYDFPATRPTLSNAMDVGAPSNFERLDALLGTDAARRVWGTSVDDADTLARMKTVWEEDGYVACPHTAVGLEGLARYRADAGAGAPAIALATAHPAKFPEVVARALPIAPPTHPALEGLAAGAERVERLEPTLASLREALLDGR